MKIVYKEIPYINDEEAKGSINHICETDSTIILPNTFTDSFNLKRLNNIAIDTFDYTRFRIQGHDIVIIHPHCLPPHNIIDYLSRRYHTFMVYYNGNASHSISFTEYQLKKNIRKWDKIEFEFLLSNYSIPVTDIHIDSLRNDRSLYKKKYF